jgi:tetratricopeptide (TPR) repeat protein
MKIPASMIFSAAIALSCVTAHADLAGDLDRESRHLKPALVAAEGFALDGHPDQAEAAILAVFPETGRTPVQSLLLGNVLFRSDPKASYDLHKTVATALPDDPDVAFEWALELHRAGEWDKAAEQYRRTIKADPDNGIAHGLLAECLIRSGHTKDASDEWQKSEEGGGSLEAFESDDCEVHSGPSPDTARAALMKKARDGDVDAAQSLVELDCAFKRDWWNTGPEPRRLKIDLDLIGKMQVADKHRLAAITAAAKCGIILAGGGGSAKDVLTSAGYLLDDNHTLAPSGKLMSTMLTAAVSGGAMTPDTARSTLGQKVIDAAKKSKEAEMFNVAARLYLSTDKLAEIDQAGWDDTSDARFAASRLVSLIAESKGTMKDDDPRLLKALKQFPDDATINGLRVRLAYQQKTLTDEMVIATIKAECTHFSGGGVLVARPSATPLRIFYKLLAERLGSEK